MASTGCYRYFIAALLFFGLVLSYMLRTNLSVAILAMVNNTALAEMNVREENSSNSVGMCPRNDQSSAVQDRDGPFLWDSAQRGVILGAFFYGYMVTEIPGGWLAYRYGGKWVILIGIFWTCVFTFMTPLTVHLDMPLLLAIRVLEGLGEGVAFPCAHAMFALWVPPSERSRMPAFILAGVGVGTVIAFPLSSWLCESSMGWPLVFYVFGAIGLCWCLLWLIFGASSPENCRWISDKERDYIKQSLAGTVSEERRTLCEVPWLSIITTPSIWALWGSHFSYSWGYYMLVTSLPTYFKDILNLDIASNGIYSSLPYLCFIFFAITGGPVADYIVGKRLVSVGAMRKIMDGIGHSLPGVFLLAATAIGCNRTVAILFMTLGVGTEGLVGAGYYANNLDVAGRFAGVTFGVSNTLGSIAGVIAPAVAGYFIAGEPAIEKWRTVFGITAGVYWFSALFFIIFGSGKTAKWAHMNDTIEKEESRTNSEVKTHVACLDSHIEKL